VEWLFLFGICVADPNNFTFGKKFGKITKRALINIEKRAILQIFLLVSVITGCCFIGI
jgi:hypothetical protein